MDFEISTIYVYIIQFDDLIEFKFTNYFFVDAIR